MRFAFADPPYLGCCGRYDHHHGDDGHDLCWDDPEAHRVLLTHLEADFPGAWAMSLHAPSLATILPMCPNTVRVMAWCKTWHQIRPLVPVQYAWEPLIVCGGRTKVNDPMVRDWMASPATRMTGTIGAKPDAFWFWLFDVLGAEAGDEFVDVFVGSGGGEDAWSRWSARPDAPLPGSLFVETS